MNSINVNIPIVNLPQVTQHQQDAHRAPMVHQAQNADMNRDRLDLQMRAPQEAEQTEGKIVDPNARREEEGKRRQKKDGRNGDDNEEGEGRPSDIAITMTDSGRIIDLEA